MNVPNPLPRFGLSRLSPSMLTLWRGNPKLWCVRYLLKVKDDSDMPKAWRGRAVEAGLNAWLYKRDPDAALAVAQSEWLNASQGITSDEIEEAKDLIPDMLGKAINAAEGWPIPTASQLRIETWLPDIPAPVIGYADWVWPDVVRDLKTTTRAPSEPSIDHAMQVALYMRSDAMKRRRGELLYVVGRAEPEVKLKKDGTPRKQRERDPDQDAKLFTLSDEDVDLAIRDARSAALSLLRFLDNARDANHATQMLPANRDHYAWTPELLDVAEAA